jgi:hypothetical protein
MTKAEEAQVQLLHTALLDVKMLRQKAANMNAEASLADDLAEKQVAAVQAALDASDAPATASAAASPAAGAAAAAAAGAGAATVDVSELQERVAVAEQASKTAEALRQEAEALMAQSQAQAAAAAQQLAALTEGASLALGELLSNGHDMIAADINSLLSLSVGTFELGGSSTTHLGEPGAVQQQQQQDGAAAEGSDDAAEGSEPADGNTSSLESHSQGGVQAALDLATAAKDALQHLIAEFAANSDKLNSLDQLSNSPSLDLSQADALLGDAETSGDLDGVGVTYPQQEGDDTAAAIDDTAAMIEEALARDIIRQNMLDFAAEHNLDDLEFFRVDEELPKGFPLLSEANAPSVERIRPDTAPQQQDKGQQQQQHQKQQQQPAANVSSDSLILAFSYYMELVGAAREHMLPAGSVNDAQLQSVRPVDAATNTHVDQLEHIFATILNQLPDASRASLMSLDPKDAFALVGAAGTPVVTLTPRISGLLRPADAVQLRDVMTAQVQAISKDLSAQVSVFCLLP